MAFDTEMCYEFSFVQFVTILKPFLHIDFLQEKYVFMFIICWLRYYDHYVKLNSGNIQK